MAMTLRLTEEQTDGLRQRARLEHRSMQQVALAAIDSYVNQPIGSERRRAVPVDELLDMFADLPPIDIDRFRTDQEKHIDDTAHFDAYLRAYVAENPQ